MRGEIQMDVEVAKRECRICLDECQVQIERLRQLVEDCDALVPDILRVSCEKSVPGMRRAAKAAIVRLQIVVQLRADNMRCDDSGDLR